MSVPATTQTPSRSRMPNENRQIASAGGMLPREIGRGKNDGQNEAQRAHDVFCRWTDKDDQARLEQFLGLGKPWARAIDECGEVGSRHRAVGDNLGEPGLLAKHEVGC